MRAISGFACILILLLAACEAPQQRLDAAQDINAFLTAARAGDEATFDRHLDREALKQNLRGELDEALAGQAKVPPSARGPLLDQMVENLGPETFQMALGAAGPLANRTPTAPEIAAVLRPVGDDRVCLPPSPGAEACAATFQRQGDVWKLVAIDASGIQVGVPAAVGEMLEQFPR